MERWMIDAHSVKVPAEGTLAERWQATCESARRECWMSESDEDKFRAALGAFSIALQGTPEHDLFMRELDELKRVNAFFGAARAGLPVGAMLKSLSDPDLADEDRIGLFKVWKGTAL